MRLTFEDRLKMCEDHVLRGKSLSHICEENGNYDITNLKYLINLYKKFGSEVFLNREDVVYYRDTKLLAISTGSDRASCFYTTRAIRCLAK